LEGSTESEIQKERNARIKVSRQLGISLEEFEQQLQPKIFSKNYKHIS
jgi:hypothetical protein